MYVSRNNIDIIVPPRLCSPPIPSIPSPFPLPMSSSPFLLPFILSPPPSFLLVHLPSSSYSLIFLLLLLPLPFSSFPSFYNI